MLATAWNDGRTTYGVRVRRADRDRYFREVWTEIQVELDGHVHRFRLTPSFWRRCSEFRDSGSPLIRRWLARHHSTEWESGSPPRFVLTPLGENRFRLEA